MAPALAQNRSKVAIHTFRDLKPNHMRIYHVTSRSAADAILQSGFLDGESVAGDPASPQGVWFAEIPVDENEGARSSEVTLVVDDGLATSSATIEVQVLTAGEAVEDIILLVLEADLGQKNKRPLLASLKAAVASLDRGSFSSAIGQLQATQTKTRAQIGKTDPATADAIIAEIQKVIDALSE